jgi:hypothetical protein
MSEAEELRLLLREAKQIVGECCDCLAYRAGEYWWERYDRFVEDEDDGLEARA